MDENSCEGETSKSTKTTGDGETSDKNQNIVHQNLKENRSIETIVNDKGGLNDNQISDSSEAGTSSEPTVSFSEAIPPQYDLIKVNSLKISSTIQKDAVLECPVISQPVNQSFEERSQVQRAPGMEQQRAKRPSIGPPPSYSFVMNQKRKGSKPVIEPSPPDFRITERSLPPPTYNGVCVSSETEGLGRICIMPSYSEPRWRSHPQPAICPRCGILVFTTTHTHDSIATHIAALALCLFGCWPCCFLPYCMSACKNTYHHCPYCQSFLGSYTPW